MSRALKLAVFFGAYDSVYHEQEKDLFKCPNKVIFRLTQPYSKHLVDAIGSPNMADKLRPGQFIFMNGNTKKELKHVNK